MRLNVHFGLIDKKEINWHQDIMDFPKIINYLDRNYEWFVYDKDPTGRFDWILNFSEIPAYDPAYNIKAQTWNELFAGRINNSCECGSNYTSFPNHHMFYCPKWRRDGY